MTVGRIVRAPTFLLLMLGASSSAIASGDPIIVVHFGLGVVIAVAAFGFVFRQWRRGEIQWLFVATYVLAVAGIWYLCWIATNLSNATLGALLIGVPLVLALLAKAVANRTGK